MKKLTFWKSLFLLFALIVGTSTSWAQDTYSKVTSLSGINTTDTYIIVCETGNVAMKVFQSGDNNHKTVSASISDGTASSVGSGVCLLTLESTGTSNQYYLKNQNNEYLLAVSGQNHLKVSSSKTDACKFTISYSGSDVTITSTVAPRSGTTWNPSAMRYNSGSTCFACYGTGQSAVAIYKKDVSTDEATSVTIDDSGITNTDIASGTTAGSFAAVVKNSSSEIIDGATVTWTSSKPAVATIDATTGAVTLVKRGTTTITASYAGVSGTYQASNNTYVLNVTNSAANDGSAAHPFTPTEARDALDNDEIESESDYYVRGIIAKKNDISSGSLTYWLSNDGSMVNNIQCYNGKYIDGESFTDATDLEVGDIATVKGKLIIYQSTTYEFSANNEVVSITPRTKVNISTFTATTPTIVINELTETTVTNDQAGWTPVSYTYESDDESVATVDANGVITAVAKGTANITVTANVAADDANYKAGESKSVEITVTNPFHNVTFFVNGVAGDPTSTEEGAAIIFPANPDNLGGKTFVGWTDEPISGTADNVDLVTSATMGTSDQTYYAVFATASAGGEDEWIATDLADLTTTDVFVIVGDNGDTYAMPNEAHTSTTNAPSVVDVTVTDNKITSAVDDNIKWNISGDATDGYTFYPNGSTTTWLYCVNNNKGVCVGTNDNKTFTISEEGYLYHVGTSRYVGIYNSADWRCYTSNSTNIAGQTFAFYKKAGGTTYSAYCTTVTVTLTPAKTYTTLTSAYALDFTTVSDDLKAFIAKDGVSEGSVKMTQVNKVPANTGLVLKATTPNSAVNVPVFDGTGADDVSGNKMVGNATETTAIERDGGYILSNGVFQPADAGTLAAGKAYLQIAVTSARSLVMSFDDATTAINGIEEVAPVNVKTRKVVKNGRLVIETANGEFTIDGARMK